MDEEEKLLPCAQKLVFDTRAQAEGAAVVLRWRYGDKLKAYKCRHCHLWHLSSG